MSERHVPTFWIRIIAISNLICSGVCLTEILRPTPNPLFGVITNGNAIFIYQALSTVVMVYTGRGLYRLNETARRVAIAFAVVSEFQYLLWWFLGPAPLSRFTGFRVGILFFGTALWLFFIWYLHTRRGFFSRL